MNIKLLELHAVVVLYNCKMSESETLKTLNKSLTYFNEKLDVLIYDNSLIVEEEVYFKKLNIKYIHNPSNPGIASAYNYAIKIANQDKKKWLLLLDQDTFLPENYFSILSGSMQENVHDNNLICFMPRVVSIQGDPISPSVMSIGGYCKPINEVVLGIQSASVTGINSGTVIRIRFIESLNGFSEKYPLDMLDHWFFNLANKYKKKIYVIGTSIVHNLSVLSFEESVSVQRYKTILRAEKEFFKSNMFNFVAYKARLTVRLIKQFSFKNKEYSRISVKAIFNKI